jgi:OFA family oxalate/formate antiporter-like MFS transporter
VDGSRAPNRWFQLIIGIVAMIMIANLQYGWTLFVPPLVAAHGWQTAAVQVAFTVFVAVQTWLVPFTSYIVDRFGPRLLVALGGVCVGASWLIDASATSLAALYAGAAVGGVGAGIVYSTTVGNALKWFPERRGLAAGLTAAGFGAGAALTVIPISNTIAAHGYQTAFATFGTIQGIVVLVIALLMVAPPQTARVAEASGADMTPAQMLATPAFYLLYVMFVLIATGALMFTAQLAVMAHDFHVASAPVKILGFTGTVLPVTLALYQVFNGLSRPAFGALSDRIGRENTMFVAFTLQAIAILVLLRGATNPTAFVVLSGLTFFTAGEIYSLFPATSADLFGRRFATTNYGLLYTAKGVSALLVPFGSIIAVRTGSWSAVFYAIVVFNLVTAVLAIAALKPLRIRAMRAAAASAAPVVAEAPA